MNVHEYQAKAILRDYGIPVLRGHAAFAPEEAVSVAKELGGPITVVKAQIHAGGRGKATLALNEVSDWVLSQARDDVVAIRSPEVFK